MLKQTANNGKREPGGKNSGFASVLIVIIMTSLISLVMIFAEAASGKAASSICENLCVVAGRSVLSEFDTELFESYGLFAFRDRPGFVQDMTEKYIDANLDSRKGFVQLSLKDLCTDTLGFEGLNTGLFSAQTEKLGALTALKDASEYIGLFTEAANTFKENDRSPDEIVSRIDSAQSSLSPDEGEEASPSVKETLKQLSKLRRDYKEATDIETEKSAGGKSINTSGLPSEILGAKKHSILLLSGGLKSPEVFSAEYAVSVCTNFLKSSEACALLGEAEYILFGNTNDAANEKAVKQSLFRLRFAMDLAFVLKDPKMIERVTAICSASFNLIPFPLAYFVVSSVIAGTEAKRDVGLLFEGKSVPLTKTHDSWEGSGASGLRYEDYLKLLMLMLSQEERSARLMDIIELNTEGFHFRDHAYGYTLNAQFSKAVRFPGYSKRVKKLEQVHQYM